jgi:hypothetical protein
MDHVNWTEMFQPEWQPPGTWQVLAVAYLVLLAVSGTLLYRLLTAPGWQARLAAPAPAARPAEHSHNG